MVCVILRPAVPVGAQSGAANWQAGAFVDIGTLQSAASPPNHLFRSRGTTPRVDEINLNMAGAYVRHLPSERSRWGFEVAAHGGEDSQTFGFSPTAPPLDGARWLRRLGPTNVTYLAPAGRGLRLQGGIFSSFVGYDSLYAKDNVSYTRPWTADFTPYLMLGANASYPVTDHLTISGFVTNGYWHLAHANDAPSVGAQLADDTRNAGPHLSRRLWRSPRRRPTRVRLRGRARCSEASIASTSRVARTAVSLRTSRTGSD